MEYELKHFIELMTKTRELSSPRIDSIAGADDYRDNLIRSFNRIAELSKTNQDILDRYFFPIIESEQTLSDHERELLIDFSASIIDSTKMENIDLPILFAISERLLKDAEERNDLHSTIIALDAMVSTAYALLTASIRLHPIYDICYNYRDLGINAANRLISYLDPELFATLDDECKEIVLINSRYIACLFAWDESSDLEAQSREDLATLEKSLRLADDPFYREQARNYDWAYHRMRTLQYITCLTEYREADSFDPAVNEKILQYTEVFIDLFRKEFPELSGECSEATLEIHLSRNLYLAHKISKEEYKSKLLEIYKMHNVHNHHSEDIYAIFTAPYEYILLIDKDNLQDEDRALLKDFYTGLPSFVYHLPRVSTLSFLMTFLGHILNEYIELEGAPGIEEMCLELMAALHPPTYVHSRTVSELTTCLCSHLIEEEPELFAGILSINNAEDVIAHKDDIIAFVSDASLLHDLGKLYIIETIITYGRRLLDMEFETIRMHPKVGAKLLESHRSTKEFSHMAYGHHKWFNDQGGYPEDFKLQDSPYKVIVSLLSVADCLDAATDTVGRNYKQSKTLDEYIEEIVAESGTRYAPYAVDLLKNPAIHEEIAFILENSREENYRKTYELLKEL